MVLPASAPWNLVAFDLSNLGVMLGLGPSDLTLTPGGSPYFTYDSSTRTVLLSSEDGVAAQGDFHVGLPNQYTVEIEARFTHLPDSHSDLGVQHLGLTVADDAGRGAAIYFAKTGLAVGPVADFGAVATLPDTADVVREVASGFQRVRVAVDGVMGVAYVFLGSADDPLPQVKAIVPVEATPPGTTDLFRLQALGTALSPVALEIRALRLGTGLIIPNFPPVANAGGDQALPLGRAARLSGRASYDIEGAGLSYQWRAVDAPFTSIYAFEGSGANTTDDGDGDGFTPILSVPPGALPSWAAAGDVLLLGGARYILDAVDIPGGTLTITQDALLDTLTGQIYRLIRQSLLSGATTDTATVVPDVVGVYKFELVVNDGQVDSLPAEVLLSTVSAAAPLGVEPSVDFLWAGLGDEWKFVENRGVFTEFWRGTAQLLGGKMLEAWQYHYGYSIRDVQDTFQRKWQALRPLVAETSPDTVEITPRYGVVLAGYDYAAGDPAVTGLTVVLDLDDGTQITATLTGDDLSTVAADLTAAFSSSAGVTAVTYGTTLRLSSGTRAFQVSSTSTAVALLFPAGYNYLSGVLGARVAERTYRVDDGVDLSVYGVTSGDFLLLNNGQVFVVDRVYTHSSDLTPFQRIVVTEDLPDDASVEWEIPSGVRSTVVDYEAQGTYPGDLVKAEVYTLSTGADTDVLGVVLAQREKKLGVHLGGLYGAFTDDHKIRLLGVKRRKAITIHPELRSIPQLQDKIPVSASPTIWRENVDYTLVPFYRGAGGSATPVLQFADSVFITPDLEPPDVLWAELAIYDNSPSIEATFGTLVKFGRDDAAVLGPDFNYAAGVAGLLFTYLQGPKPAALKAGAQMLLGQPFAETKATITEINHLFSPGRGRIVMQDEDGHVPTESEVFRTYTYQKDPLDLTDTSGLEISPVTSAPYAVGDLVEQFAPLGAGVLVKDLYNDPDWYIPYVRSGILTELEKFMTYAVEVNSDLSSVLPMALVEQFLLRTDPTFARYMLVAAKNVSTDIDVQDDFDGVLELHLYDSVFSSGFAYMYDDYRGDGTMWSASDDGATFFNSLMDTTSDVVTLELTIAWTPTGVIRSDSIFFYDTQVIDVGGAMGPPGGLLTLHYDDILAAGTYTVIATIDSGNKILP